MIETSSSFWLILPYSSQFAVSPAMPFCVSLGPRYLPTVYHGQILSDSLLVRGALSNLGEEPSATHYSYQAASPLGNIWRSRVFS